MSRPEAHPDPPPDLHERTLLIKTTAGPWVRLHDWRHAPLHFSRGAASRFNDPQDEFGVLYVAEDFPGAFIERFGRSLDVRSVTAAALSSTAIAEVGARRRLRLVDLASTGGTARLSADARLTSGDFRVSQAWARALWLHPVSADGLYYRLRHDPARCGCALFNRTRAALTIVSRGTTWDSPHRSALSQALETYGFGLIVE